MKRLMAKASAVVGGIVLMLSSPTTAYAQETDNETVHIEKTSSLSNCEYVPNVYSIKELEQWTTYQGFITDYYLSCQTSPQSSGQWSGFWGGHRNGAIPPNQLQVVGEDVLLKPDAAKAFEQMNAAYKADTGKDLQVNSSYRPYNDQWSTWITSPDVGAYPGTSGHGWGTSIDLATAGDFVAQGEWLAENSEQFGWINPYWADDGVAPEEPWHFDYLEPSHPKICASLVNINCVVL